ncbi:MAG: hypothetical protein H6607_04820 [Flavobacteriales bacterium]|nr:hypothetical protein [Flavobacteriales bacterium]
MSEIDKYKPIFVDISDWDFISYQNTGGTRNKSFVINSHNQKEFFFKGSKINNDGTVKYPTEFWSEIVASKIGQILGFRILDYNIGYDSNFRNKQSMGCLSESMVELDKNKLTEGIYYLKGFDSGYKPSLDKNKYTFQFIQQSLTKFKLESILIDLVETIIFDAIIGNSDRHQENWGVIVEYEKITNQLEGSQNSENGLFLKINSKILNWTLSSLRKIKPIFKPILHFDSEIAENIFAPIYDSGCCLGRELEVERIMRMLKNDKELLDYINRGKSEIHWNMKKVGHFELVANLRDEFDSTIVKTIKRIRSLYLSESLENLISNIDSNLPLELEPNKLPDYRKELMIKIINLRVQKILNLVE